LQEREHKVPFPPSKKPRPAENFTSQQAGVEDDVWGDDLDASSVDECYLLASQALSQVCTTNEVCNRKVFHHSLMTPFQRVNSFYSYVSLFYTYLTLQAEGVGLYADYFSWCCMQKLPHFDHIYFCVYVISLSYPVIFVHVNSRGKGTATDKTKYMVMSLDRNAGQGDGVKIDNRSIERVEEFKYL
jgi:hypothetical protein